MVNIVISVFFSFLSFCFCFVGLPCFGLIHLQLRHHCEPIYFLYCVFNAFFICIYVFFDLYPFLHIISFLLFLNAVMIDTVDISLPSCSSFSSCVPSCSSIFFIVSGSCTRKGTQKYSNINKSFKTPHTASFYIYNHNHK